VTSEFGAQTSQACQGEAEQGGRGSTIRGCYWCTIEDENMAQAVLATVAEFWQRDNATQTGTIPNLTAVFRAIVLA